MGKIIVHFAIFEFQEDLPMQLAFFEISIPWISYSKNYLIILRHRFISSVPSISNMMKIPTMWTDLHQTKYPKKRLRCIKSLKEIATLLITRVLLWLMYLLNIILPSPLQAQRPSITLIIHSITTTTITTLPYTGPTANQMM